MSKIKIGIIGTGSISNFHLAAYKSNPNVEIYTEMNDYLVDVNFNARSSMGSMEDIFSGEINHFVDCVQGKCECKNPAEDGVEIMKILSAIYESARTGHEVVL